MKTAAVAYVERDDEKLLCVWNQRYGGWAFPGGLVEEGESVEAGLGRELEEETGLQLASCELIYSGPHGIANPDRTRAQNVHIFRVQVHGVPREMEDGCPVTWLTREQFLKWSPFASLYAQVFAAVPPSSRGCGPCRKNDR